MIMEISKQEAELVVDAVDSIHLEGMGFGKKEKEALDLVEKIHREFPDLVDTEVLERFDNHSYTEEHNNDS